MSNIVKFKTLQIQNFKSFGPKVTIDFSKHHGLNYVYGINKDIEGTSNGSGKSNIFCALLFALYGKTINNTNNRFVPNRVISDKNLITDVILDFEVNNKQYRVRSFIKHRKHPYIASCQLWEGTFDDDGEITKSSARETRRYLEKQILKCSYQLFKSSVILSSSDTRNFFEMKKQQKRQYVEDIFELAIFGDMMSVIKKDINNLDKQILTIQKQCNQQKESLQEFKLKDKDFDDDQVIIIKQFAKKIKDKKQQISQLKLSLTEQEKQQDISDKDNVFAIQLQKVEDGILKVDSLLKRTDSDMISFQREIDKHEEVLSIICSDCKGVVEQKYNINDCHHGLQILTDKKKKYQKNLIALNNKKQQLVENVNRINHQIKESNKLHELIKHNQWTKNHLIDEIKDLASKIKQEQIKKSPFSELIDKYQIEVDSKNQLLQQYFEEKGYLEVLKHVVSEDGAKKYIIKDLVEILNQLIRKYLEQMGADFTCVFDTSFDVVFLTNTGECEYSSFSAGERQRLVISTLLSFRDILNSGGSFESNLFVLDELIDANVDNYCIQSLVNILNKQVEEKNTTIFVISHRETVRPEDFDNIIEVQKKNSISTIVNDPQGGINSEE